MIMTQMADEAGSVAVVSEEEETQHLFVACVAIMAKEVTRPLKSKT